LLEDGNNFKNYRRRPWGSGWWAENVNRLSFADALAWLRHGDLSTPIPIELKINPLRPGRLEPRAIKRAERRFPHMTQPRAKLKSQLREKYCVAT
jgi:hypothetical protein